MTSFQNLSTAQKARAALHRDVRAICTEACHFLGMEMTKPAMEIVAELLYKKIGVYGCDLEAFAKHAKRSTVTSEDVKLLVRRNSSLKMHLNTIACNSATKEKRRKTNVTVPNAKLEETKTNEPELIEENKQAEENTIEDNNMVVDTTIDLTFD